MSDRRTASLLDFAITASVAVVPIMLAVLLGVGVIRPGEDAAAPWRGPNDRYVSVRHVAALKTFESAILERPAAAPGAPSAADVVEGIPQCRREWSPSWRASAWLPQALRSNEPSPAEHVASGLAAFDAALLRFSTRANPRVTRPVGLDTARWFAAARKSLDDTLETSQYPGKRFHVRCGDLAVALSALLRADARMLEALTWRGTATLAASAGWAPEQQMEITPRHVMRRNPWNGIAGCIYLGGKDADEAKGPTHFVAAANGAQARLCGLQAVSGATADKAPALLRGEPGPADAVDDTRWMVPPSLHKILEPLESLRQPSRALYRLYTETADAANGEPPTAYRYGPNRIVLDGAEVDIGFSVRLTIDPALQAVAQKVAACYTGRQDVCRALGVRRAEDVQATVGHRLLEHAMVRMAAVAIVDVASGRIEALAGAMSPCARQEVDGPGRDDRCDRRLPYPVRYRPDALLNPALFHDAMPASTVKPIMAAAFLADPQSGKRWMGAERVAMQRSAPPTRDSLRGQLMRSDSARFLDRMFCIEKGFEHCRRPWDVQSSALAFGWNAACSDPNSDCGKHDVLFGRVVDATAEAGIIRPLSTTVAYGRLMSEPASGRPSASMHLTPLLDLNPALVKRCAAGADGSRLSDDDWEKCRGGAMVDIVAEGWGQGHARATTLGVAGMMATLAAAANGQPEVRRPHLVASLFGAGAAGAAPLEPAVARWGLAAPQPVRLPRDAAEVILSGLTYSHRAGTARSACEQVFDARRCREIDWLAGKTGTPSFPSDGVTLDQLSTLCRGGKVPQRARPGTCSSLRPYKWYVAAYRTDRSGSGPWTKAIAVLSERNWLQGSGLVHGAGDHGPNPSAEIAMQVAGRHVGAISGERAMKKSAAQPQLPVPLVWTFDGPFERCLADLDDTLRRAIVLVGDVSRVAMQIDVSLPALQRRVDAGEALQPAWGRFIDRMARYGLPASPRVRHLRAEGPLATLVVAYRR